VLKELKMGVASIRSKRNKKIMILQFQYLLIREMIKHEHIGGLVE
jgi:hypothetical protein